MKSLLSVTPKEFKHNFSGVMEMASDMCMGIQQEIAITIPERKNGTRHVEIVKVTPVGGGIKYSYNHELLKKYGINTDDRMNRLENAIADAFEKSGLAEYGRKNKEAIGKMQEAMMIAAKNIMKQFNVKF